MTELTPIQAYYVGIGPENRELSKLSKVLSKDCVMDSLCKVHVSEKSTNELSVLVEGDANADPVLPSTSPENMQKIYGNLRFVLVMERNSPESSQYSLCDYMVAYRQCKGLYLLKRKVTEKPDQMFLVVDESCDSTLQLNTSTFECKLQNEGQMCKRCEAYKEGPRHQRKMQLDQFYCFDQSLLREQIQRLCKTFVLN